MPALHNAYASCDFIRISRLPITRGCGDTLRWASETSLFNARCKSITCAQDIVLLRASIHIAHDAASNHLVYRCRPSLQPRKQWQWRSCEILDMVHNIVVLLQSMCTTTKAEQPPQTIPGVPIDFRRSPDGRERIMETMQCSGIPVAQLSWS